MNPLKEKYPRLARTEQEIEARMEALDPKDPHWFVQSRLLDGVLTMEWDEDLRAAARTFAEDVLMMGLAIVGPHVSILRQYAWLLGRDDVVSEMDRAHRDRGGYWSQMWAFCCTFDSATERHWGAAVQRKPEIAEWAAGLVTA